MPIALTAPTATSAACATEPLALVVAVVPVPDEATVRSRGLVVSTPLYSSTEIVALTLAERLQVLAVVDCDAALAT